MWWLQDLRLTKLSISAHQNEISRLSEMYFQVDLCFKTCLDSLPLDIWWILNQHLSIPCGWASSQSWDETGLATSGDWRGCLFKSSTQGRVSRAGLMQHFRKSSDMASNLDSPQRTFWKLVSYYERKRTMNLALLLKWFESSVKLTLKLNGINDNYTTELNRNGSFDKRYR